MLIRCLFLKHTACLYHIHTSVPRFPIVVLTIHLPKVLIIVYVFLLCIPVIVSGFSFIGVSMLARVGKTFASSVIRMNPVRPWGFVPLLICSAALRFFGTQYTVVAFCSIDHNS